MKAQYDYLTLILPINGKEKEAIKETQGDVEIKFLHQDYLTYHLQKVLGGLFDQKRFGFFQSFEFNKEIFIIKNRQYEIHFRGKFFLRDSFELFNLIYGEIIELGYTPHISRLDICFTFEAEFHELAKMLLRSDFKNLEVLSKRKKKKLIYLNAKNVRFEFLAYPKSSQIRRLKDKEYVSRFQKKYGKSENLSRIEARLHNKFNLEELTTKLRLSYKTFFREALDDLLPHIATRMKPVRKIMKAQALAISDLKNSL